MIASSSRLVMLVELIDHIPLPCQEKGGGRGRPCQYSERLFLKAVLIMIVRHITTVHGFLQVLQEETTEMQELRSRLTEQGRFPSRRTWERRLQTMPTTLPDQIACVGQHLVDLIHPWQTSGRAVAIDSTALRACGGVWHKKHRDAGFVPHPSIDTEAHWSKSGWHGWWYGWKLHVACTVGDCWIPLAAQVTPANVADGETALAVVQCLPHDARFVVGDAHYQTDALQAWCDETQRILVCSRGKRRRHANDPGREVRRLLHRLRSITIENWNEQFKSLFDGHGQVPTKGHVNTQRFALGAVFVYQVILLYRFQQGLGLRQGLKSFLKAS